MNSKTVLFKENEKKNEVKKMFDSIAPKYDFLNRLLSAGIDNYWRKKTLKLADANENTILFDVACGTGDVAIMARKLGVKNIFGADFSHNMLSLFEVKSEWIKGKDIQIAAENIPVKDESFTLITVAFGVRNFYDIQAAFKEFQRVLKPGGKSAILEFRMPSNPVVKALYIFYFKNILPFFGKLISGHPTAYKYLPDSVEDFDKNVDLVKLFREAGFSKAQRHSLTFGIAQVVIAEK